MLQLGDDLMAFLKIMTGTLKGQKFEIDRDEVVIGRAAENVVSIEDPAMSSHHCAVLRNGRRFTLKDHNSTNGTRLNSVSIKEYRLSPKDIFTVGSVDILFDGGEEVEPFDPPRASGSGPQVTVRLSNPSGAASPIGNATGFEAKKDSRVIWIVLLSIVGVLALAALGFFLYRLFTSGSTVPL